MPRFVRISIVCSGLIALVSGCGDEDVAKVQGTPAPTTEAAAPVAKGKRGPKASESDSVSKIQLQ